MNKTKPWPLTAIVLIAGCTVSNTTQMNTTANTTVVSEDTEVVWKKIVPDYEPICKQGEDRNGPWNNDLDLNWFDPTTDTVENAGTLAAAAGVPTVVEDQTGRLVTAFQWFACDTPQDFDKIAIATSDDGGITWSKPQPAIFADIPSTYQRPFDPTLTVLSDGRIRMYFTTTLSNSYTLGKNTDIYSAISDDGIHYTFEPGARFDLTDGAAYDSAVGYWNNQWHLITPQNDVEPRGAYHAISEDGLTFEWVDDIFSEDDLNWTGNFLAKDDGLYFYGSPNKGKNWWVRTTDGTSWSLPVYINLHGGGDPAVVCPTSQKQCLFITVKLPAGSLLTPPPQPQL